MLQIVSMKDKARINGRPIKIDVLTGKDEEEYWAEAQRKYLEQKAVTPTTIIQSHICISTSYLLH
jgi:hypothetical protein